MCCRASAAVSFISQVETVNGAQGASTDVGVTKEACPKAVNKSHGCIYLGAISDLTTGPFKALAVPITDAQKAFWKRVNEKGGIGNYDIDVETYIRDNHYNPQTRVFSRPLSVFLETLAGKDDGAHLVYQVAS